MASIVVSGYMLRHPFSDGATICLQLLLGLAQLSEEILYVEGSDWPHACSAIAHVPPDLRHATLLRARETLLMEGAQVPLVWVDQGAGLVEGMVWPQLRARVAQADVLLDMGAACMLDERARAGRRALVDLDTRPAHGEGFAPDDYDVHFSYVDRRSAISRGMAPSENARVLLERVLEDDIRSPIRAAA